ncbi:adenine-specific methyltransferase EcoRI family protein [Halarcobacter bivalviorum]|uniref:adenine-specific methyltransferase EcoRI family protein n=1 Tax=Halarcobacter bivalviorum TaxID=663364 RepID=UPI00100C1D54|nr:MULTISPECIES: adenine-specific methyltransferase EcoRI family protein [Arcobacteraceae]RXK03605.1 modification methylase [Halarcobacter bivalviorum]RYA23698.1 modification methylase [Malaciobacter halophilus]
MNIETKNSSNRKLTTAKKNKSDEFYTQISDIERELKNYTEHFKGKTIFCNCDDPEWSNFWKYFELNFEHLGIKKLISTHYQGENSSYKLEIIGDINHDGKVNNLDIVKTPLKENGDFRSKEAIEILKEADIVVTNPPFSLFREYVQQLVDYNKKFLIIGHQNATKYKEIFKLIIDNKIWLGYGFKGGAAHFINKHYEDYATATDRKEGMIRVSGVVWLTNLEHKKRNEDIILYKTYNEQEYPKYDNYDAIEVSQTKNIPIDYEGVMGVPITFLNKYNPEQFEIVGMTSGRDEFEATPTKRYINPKQVNKDGSISNGSKVNTSSTILYNTIPDGVYYKADNADGYLKVLYTRFLIKNKRL